MLLFLFFRQGKLGQLVDILDVDEANFSHLVRDQQPLDCVELHSLEVGDSLEVAALTND